MAVVFKIELHSDSVLRRGREVGDYEIHEVTEKVWFLVDILVQKEMNGSLVIYFSPIGTEVDFHH